MENVMVVLLLLLLFAASLKPTNSKNRTPVLELHSEYGSDSDFECNYRI
jgi:hypothetical protein